MIKYDCFIHLDANESEVWTDFDTDEAISSDEESPPSSPKESEVLLTPIERSFSSLIKWLIGFLLLLQARFHMSQSVMDAIFHFMKTFFVVLSRLCPSSAPLSHQFPKTLYTAKKEYVSGKGRFIKSPVCKKCGKVWKYNDCFEGHGSNRKAKLCSYVSPFGRRSRRAECNGVLLKTVELATGKRMFYPLMTYCYIDLCTSLQHLLLDNTFTSNCLHWKSLQESSGVLRDVYDGRVWKKFMQNERFSDNFYAFMIGSSPINT